MKIGLISPYDWDYPGGVHSHIEHLAAEFRQRGHSVRIIAPSSQGRQSAVEYGVYHVGWSAPLRLNGSVARVAVTPYLTGALRRLMRHEDFDVVHLHEPLVSTLTLAALRLASDMGIACVGTFHASSSKRSSTASLAYSMASPFLQASFRRLDGCIAVSDAALEHVQRHFPADYHIIPNGIDLQRFSHAGRIKQFDDGVRNVLFFSRLEPRKGLRYLLKAIPLIQDHLGERQVRFIIAGDGPQRVKFQHFVQRHGWPNVIFTGYVTDEEKSTYFATADCFCSPAVGNESQGIVLLEAMAAGVPVVASNIAGYRTVIPSAEYGLLTPPRDAERLAWAICHLLREDELRHSIAQHARERVETYSWQRVTTAVEQVYEEGIRHRAERQVARRSFSPGTAQPQPTGVVWTSGWGVSSRKQNVVE